jgi:integrase/recombinase XerC
MHIDLFIKYLKYEKRYSLHTICSYENDLDKFVEFYNFDRDTFDPLAISHHEIRKWIVFLMECGYSSRTINRKLSTLKSFYKYLLQENQVKQSPLTNISAPKVNKKLPNFVERDRMDLLLDKVDFGVEFESLRDKLVLELLYLTGIRLSELIGIKVDDVDYNDKNIRVLGKRNKERIIPVSNELLSSIKEYLNNRMKLDVINTNKLILTNKGEEAYPKLVYRIVRKYLEQVTTIEKKSPHVLRHTFATHMLNSGADLNAIKEILGHANLSATEVYTHNTFEKLKSIYKQAHPRA